ncbi:hypothetical protein P152DRAFT_516157 [Eremomyces bilateralis CBS 781.70]|uniref:Amino acid transporter transmembrane domain-containing protein n=1 Tax=Eremomyces bilateralis CBS 781.70 TaxID=1392243 RepID=A0A6G1FX86_9PEZI|nr:uncharacterized protein P152DRAFT_516157 [Eremomyces bilateralis CBS 781.70]KAF1810290.1 hypothetical protein P152DRAFT_516157 [Eremomyces bilateralis CBS 781.70]
MADVATYIDEEKDLAMTPRTLSPENNDGEVVIPGQKLPGFWWQRWGQGLNLKDQFAHEEHQAVKYKVLEWWQVGALMIAETISLGILSLPQAVAALGMIPGLVFIFVMGGLAWITGNEYGKLKLKYPGICDVADSGYMLFGRFGWYLFSIAQLVVFVFIMAAHITSFSIMMNVVTEHGACSILFALTGFGVSFILALPRTLKSQSIFSFVSCVSVTAAVIITMISVGVTKPNPNNFQWANTASDFPHAMVALLNIIMAYSGHVAYFGFTSELREPKDFWKSLTMLLGSSSVLYIVTGCVIYYYVGTGVPSPALGAASPLVRKIAYGIAVPTIVVAGVINGHVASKHVYLRVWRETSVPHERTFKSWSSWVGIVFALWVLAWIIAEAIPNFHHLLALVSALFCGWFSFGITGFFYLYRNWEDIRQGKRKLGVVFNIGIVIMGFLICILGLYASITTLSQGEGGSPFSCADNADE